MTLFDSITLFIISLVANIFSAFAGGGAGLIQLPALIFLGLAFKIALATHKVASVFLGIGATLRNLKEKRLNRRFAVFILATGLPGVVVGANIILNIENRTAEIALGLLTIGLGVYSYFKPDLGQHFTPTHRNSSGYIIGGTILFFIGILNGSLTSGTGLFVTLWLIRWFGLDYKTAVSYTLILVGLFWNGSGAITLGIMSEIAWSWLPALILGSLLGGYIGAHLAIKKGNQWIKVIYEIITVTVGSSLLLN
ncbi:MAG TPA: sulfite exporter TauE/SafE family protein [Gammaproteobacteria bacterium]|nr:sulfite exporter TauE/SafE family protein [Gammaproteobacteria bacterium]